MSHFYTQIITDDLSIDIPVDFTALFRAAVEDAERNLKYRVQWWEEAAAIMAAYPTTFRELRGLGEFMRMFPAQYRDHESSLDVKVDSNISVTVQGPKAFFHMILAYLIKAGWNPPKLTEHNVTYYYNTVRRRDDDVRVTGKAGVPITPSLVLNLVSTSCRRELVGKEMQEVEIYRTICE